MPYKEEIVTIADDEGKVKDAALHGGRMALKVTAGVPVVMALGYLLLIIYFKLQGGYNPIVLTAGGNEED